jgi:hypothetical protein
MLILTQPEHGEGPYAVLLLGPVILLAELFNVRYDSVTFARQVIVKEDDMPGRQSKNATMHFKTTIQSEIPQGRNGKHKRIVILSDLDGLKAGSALKIPLAELAESKEKVRSALNRATRKASRKVATASDSAYLYVWNASE